MLGDVFVSLLIVLVWMCALVFVMCYVFSVNVYVFEFRLLFPMVNECYMVSNDFMFFYVQCVG